MALIPGNLPLKIIPGIIFGPVVMTAKDENDQPIDLTGWKVFAEVRKKPGSSSVIRDLHPFFSNQAAGQITLPKMTDEETYDLKAGDYAWDLILEDPFGDRRGPYIAGPFTIYPNVTKPLQGVLFNA